MPGSPINALRVLPRFAEYHFVDLEQSKVEHLSKLVGDDPTVKVYEGDCNETLLHQILPTIRFDDYRRALCLLDPYGLSLRWDVIRKAGELGTVDLFLNFPIMDMNRNTLWRDPKGVDPEDVARMNAFWGDESWKAIVYGKKQGNLFGEPRLLKTASNDDIAEAFRVRLREHAGFAEVPEPMPMRNSSGAIVYYLFFAAQKAVAAKIAKDVFKTYRHRGAL